MNIEYIKNLLKQKESLTLEFKEVGTDKLPYEFDMFAKLRDTDRWDDRETITCNLIEAFEKVTAFIAKHLPDRFDLNGMHRISRRDIIFREVIANMFIII